MKMYCVISHTHWDREWYMPIEAFRLKLVDLIDRCLLTLEKYPEFIFHLDGQTIVLEDYLSIRPSKKEELKKYVSEGRLIVGPWYLQNDFYLTSGEATVRNLLTGTRIAEEYGDCGHTGYAPDQFGNISQLPQILDNFGIDHFVFGRGYSQFEMKDGQEVRVPKKSEFIWRGPDGTEVLAIHMKYWYNNAQRFSENLEVAQHLLDVIDASFENIAVSPYLLLMNGVDHLEAQDNLLPILEGLNKNMDSDRRVCQIRLDEYAKHVQNYIKEHDVKMDLYEGELRNGTDYDLLKGTLSSRAYLKRDNVIAQNRLENQMEPLYSILEIAGARGAYSMDHFRYMWKELMKNHPHDSICGCSRDEVHMHMEDNFKRIHEMSLEMQARGLRTIAEHMDLPDATKDDFVVIVANTTEKVRSEVVEAVVDIPVKDNMDGFVMLDENGKSVDYQVLSKKTVVKDIFSPINLPGCMDVIRFNIRFMAENVNPYAVKGYTLKKADACGCTCACEEEKCGLHMENEALSVDITKDGVVNVLDKKTGKAYADVLQVEESGDRGDSYIYFDTEEPVIWAKTDSVEVLENSNLRQSVKIEKSMEVPAYYDFENVKRSEETVVCKVALVLTLKAGNPFVEVSYKVENFAKDHRIRLVVNTGIAGNMSTADIPFDIVTHAMDDHYQRTQSKVRPNTSFALLEDGTDGVAVFTEGAHEYEHLPEGKLAFTIVRSTGVITRNPDLSFTSGETWLCPENQCIRTLEGRIGICTYAGDYKEAQIPFVSKEFRNPLLAYCTSCDAKKFAGGRTAVQDSTLEELFFLPDIYADVKIKNNHSYIQIDGENTIITAIKKSEDEKGHVLRFLNYGEEENVKVSCDGGLCMSNMNEDVCGERVEDQIEVTAGKKKVISIRIK